MDHADMLFKFMIYIPTGAKLNAFLKAWD
jgi:hypothetical protein